MNRFNKEILYESESLINAAIANWPTLKNTSSEAFRTSFLQRDGLIKKQGRDWRLKVDQKTYDVVLDHLSWPIGIVRLPWMNSTLFVEW